METYTICLICERLNRIPLLTPGSLKSVNCAGCRIDLPFKEGVTDANLKGLKALIAKSPNPVLVNFESAKSPDAKPYNSTFVQVANQWSAQITFVKINLDKEPAAGEFYKVWSTPQTCLFKNDKEMSRKSGIIAATDLTSWIRGVLAEF